MAQAQRNGSPWTRTVILHWYGDYHDCAFQNYRHKNLSIPVFTVCARVDCDYAWPFPNYRTIHDSMASSKDWDSVSTTSITAQPQKHSYYPWHTKRKQVVWRGSLTGGLRNYASPRARIALFAAKQQQTNNSLFDMGITSIPPPWDHQNRSGLGFADSISPMSAFQGYRAILDTDGNSWSSRFGLLLCYNSVILKVEPDFVDYFHFKYLKPWEHYIPVAGDLSDLEDKARYVMNDTNTETVQRIIRNANDWCRTHMVYDAIATDMLDVLEAYAVTLEKSDLSWASKFEAEKKGIESSLDMYRVPDPTRNSDPMLLRYCRSC